VGNKLKPDWVAPEGRRRNDLYVGVPVRFSYRLEEQKHDRDGWRGWQRVYVGDGKGIVVGLANPYSGPVSEHFDGEILEYRIDYKRRRRRVVHNAVVVTSSLGKRFSYVLTNDIERNW